MSKTHKTFGSVVPAYFLSRPRGVYEAAYAKKASVTAMPVKTDDQAVPATYAA